MNRVHKLFLNMCVLALLALVFLLISPTIMAAVTDWVSSGDDIYFTSGKVGIGTDSPSNLFEVKSTTSSQGSITPSNPSKISEVYDGDGTFSYLDQNMSVVVDGNYAYVAAYRDNAVQIIDISNPYTPTQTAAIYNGDGVFSKLGNPVDIKILGNYAYVVSANSSSLTVVDISNPITPTLAAEVYDGDGEFNKLLGANRITIDGNYAYVSAQLDHATSIIDISNPSNPNIVAEMYDGDGTFSRLNRVQESYVDGNYLYITAYGDNALTIVDVSNKSAPTLVAEVYDGDGEFTHLLGVSTIEKNGNYLYVGSYDDAITIVDVSNPNAPTQEAVLYDGDGIYSKLETVRDLTIYDNYLFAAALDDNAITVIELQSATSLVKKAEVDLGTGGSTNGMAMPNKVFVDDTYFFIASHANDTHLIYQYNSIQTTSQDALSVTNDGNVGVGTNSPTVELDVDGLVKLPVNTSAPATCDADRDGAIALTSGYVACVCKNGTGWVELSDGTSSCGW